MGYDLHITRRRNWHDEGDDISLGEFESYMSLDQEFRHPGRSGDHYADWQSPKTAYQSWLSWSEGVIYTKNPEPEFIDKMVVVAQALQAKVQGDDGEVYLSATEIEKEPEFPGMVSSYGPVSSFLKWPFWMQLVAGFLLGCVLLILKLILTR